MGNLPQIDPRSNNLTQVIYLFGRCHSSGTTIKGVHRTCLVSKEAKLEIAEIEIIAVKAGDLIKVVYAARQSVSGARRIERGELATGTPNKTADRHGLLVPVVANDSP